jgi:DNA-binding HxlR family transcriptional regulator
MAGPTTTPDSDSISAALAVIGDRWSLLVLRGVFRGLHRFSELRDDLGIASNLLTTRLCALVEADVLEKVPYQERPVRHEYRLTPAGRDLSPVLVALMQWGDTHRSPHGAPTTLLHAACDAPIENINRCTSCGSSIDAHEIRSDTATQPPEAP